MRKVTTTLLVLLVFCTLELVPSKSNAHKLDIFEGRLTGVSYPTSRLTGVSYPTSRLTGVSYPTARLTGVSYPTSRLTGVSYPTARLTGVSYPTLKEACTDFSEGRLTGVSYPTARLTGVSYPTNRLTGVSYPTSRLTGVSYPTARLADKEDLDHSHSREGELDIVEVELNDEICAVTRNGIASVPTLSEWGMIITASALALIGVLFGRRKGPLRLHR